jgi:quercetin dioxygenase-like cupin family protein
MRPLPSKDPLRSPPSPRRTNEVHDEFEDAGLRFSDVAAISDPSRPHPAHADDANEGVVSARTPRPLQAPLLRFNLLQEISSLHGEVEYARDQHNARTLIKHSEFRLVLVSLKAGAHVPRAQSDQHIALQPLRGHLRLHLQNEVVNVHADQLLSLDRDLSYSLEAVEDSDILLWVGWSSS